MVNIEGNDCEVLLFRLSRLYPVDFLDELVKAVDCKFYVDDVNFPICVAYPCKGGMMVRYPFSNSPVINVLFMLWRLLGSFVYIHDTF